VQVTLSLSDWCWVCIWSSLARMVLKPAESASGGVVSGCVAAGAVVCVFVAVAWVVAGAPPVVWCSAHAPPLGWCSVLLSPPVASVVMVLATYWVVISANAPSLLLLACVGVVVRCSVSLLSLLASTSSCRNLAGGGAFLVGRSTGFFDFLCGFFLGMLNVVSIIQCFTFNAILCF